MKSPAFLTTLFLVALTAAAQQSPRTDFPSYTGGQPIPMRVAIVGLQHGHVDGFLQGLPRHPEVQLVGIADADSSLIEKYQQKFHLDPSLFFKSEANMIEVRRPHWVLVYTPISQHRPAIDIAAQYGVSVMVEKPLTISTDDAYHIRDMVNQYKVQVLVNYETTWYASNRAAFDALSQNKLGTPRRFVVHDGHEGPEEINVPPEFLSWLTDPAQNGAGALYDFGCYGADLMTVMMHGEVPVSVTAVSQTDKPETYPHVDDDATIIVRYPKTQAVLMPSWDWSFARKDMEVYGTKGIAVAIDPTRYSTRFSYKEVPMPTTATPLAAPEDTSLHYLAAVVRKQFVPKGDLTALDTNMIVMQILDAARQSAATGKTIQLHPLPN